MRWEFTGHMEERKWCRLLCVLTGLGVGVGRVPVTPICLPCQNFNVRRASVFCPLCFHCKGTVHSVTGHEGPEVEQRYSFTLCLTSALDRGGWSTPRPGRFTSGKDPVSVVWEARWAPGRFWAGEENLAPTGIRSPDRRTRSESLYLLRYPGTRVSIVTPSNEVIHKYPRVPDPVKKFPNFIQLKVSLPCSQNPHNASHPEYSPNSAVLFL